LPDVDEYRVDDVCAPGGRGKFVATVIT
jgi:hypothetical protein